MSKISYFDNPSESFQKLDENIYSTVDTFLKNKNVIQCLK